jgi:hypothetical protein
MVPFAQDKTGADGEIKDVKARQLVSERLVQLAAWTQRLLRQGA